MLSNIKAVDLVTAQQQRCVEIKSELLSPQIPATALKTGDACYRASVECALDVTIYNENELLRAYTRMYNSIKGIWFELQIICYGSIILLVLSFLCKRGDYFEKNI